MRSSSTLAFDSFLFTLTDLILSFFHLEDITVQCPPPRRSRHGGRASAQSVDNDNDNNRGIIIGSTLGGAALFLVCLALVLYPIWQRHRTPLDRDPGRLSKSWPSSSPAMPRPSASDLDAHRVRPVTPPPRRLVAINTSLPISTPWDVEKATVVHTPSDHPATIGWRGGGCSGNGNILGGDERPVLVESSAVRSPNNDDDDDDDDQQPVKLGSSEDASISSMFAAEMSSILESISIKSSYSSLRSSGAAVLGVPTRLQTPLSVQKLRKGSCGGGAARRSVSVVGGAGGSYAGPNSLSTRVPSKSPPPRRSDDNKTEEEEEEEKEKK